MRPFINFMLRSATLVSRFLLAFVLAKFLSLEELGIFGLMTASLVFCQLVIGLEFYTYSQRELISQGTKKRSFVLQHQCLTLATSYVIISPFFVLIFYFDVFPKQFIIWFFLLLIFESTSQELNRILIALQSQLIASITLFLRHGFWVLLVIPMMWYNHDLRSLDTIFTAWFCAAFLSIFFATLRVKTLVKSWKAWPFDLKWIFSGLRVSFVYLLGALCFRAIFTVDKFFISEFVGLEFLGVYTVFIGLALTVVTLLDPLIFSFVVPELIALVRDGDIESFLRKIQKLLWSTTVTLLIGIVCIVVLSPTVINWIGKPELQDNLNVLWILLGAAFFYGISFVPHFGLYALGEDHSLFKSHLICLLCVLVFMKLFDFLISPHEVVPASLVAGFCTMVLFKSWYFRKAKKSLVT